MDDKARPSCSTVAISGRDTSHMTISRCSLFLSQRGIFSLLAPTSGGHRKISKSIVLHMVLQSSVFLLFFQRKTSIYSNIFSSEKKTSLHIFMQHPCHVSFISSCTKSCFFFFSCTISCLFLRFFRAPYRFFLFCVFFPCAIFFSAFFRAPYRVFFYVFFRAPYLFFFCVFSCTISRCFCNLRAPMHQIVRKIVLL